MRNKEFLSIKNDDELTHKHGNKIIIKFSQGKGKNYESSRLKT